jgi:poly-gamma-glutamate capsule biosynthesis protein CapA/YwtB (metallophosphatase superfamily)
VFWAARRLIGTAVLCSLVLHGVAGCGPPALESGALAEQEAKLPTPTVSPAPCLATQRDLWEEEAGFFTALLQHHPQCEAGPVEDPAQAMELLSAGQSQLAVVSGQTPGPGAVLIRREPFVLVSHPMSSLEETQWARVRDLFAREGEYRPVVVADGKAAKELLGIGQLAPGAIHVSSWREARERVHDDRWLIALLPWREVNFQVRALAINEHTIAAASLENSPYQRRWWLVGDIEGHPELSQAVREGLQLENEPLISLVAVGDVMLGRAVGELIAAHTPSYPFRHMGDLLREADIAFGNLEHPITSRGAPRGGISLCGRPEVAGGLRDAGFDVLSLANNHITDYGDEGVLDTMAHLEGQGIAHVGLEGGENGGRGAVVLEVKGLRIAFLAYNHIGPRIRGEDGGMNGPAWLEPERVYADVRHAAAHSDFVVVSLHWGVEYLPQPDEFQRRVASRALEAGAGLVIGHHPHVVGEVSFEERGIVAYSLGNFVFDQTFSVETLQGLILRGLIDRTGLKQVQLMPVQIEDGQPRVLPEAEARSVISQIFEFGHNLSAYAQESGLPYEEAFRRQGLDIEWALELGSPVRELRLCASEEVKGPWIAVATGSPGGPSSIRALDSDGSTLWEYDLRQQINDLECGDLNGDGKSEIIVATGLLDAPGEVLALDSRGHVYWRFGVEASVLDVALGSVDGDDLPEVAAGEWGSFGDTIYLLDGDGRLRWKRWTGGSVHHVEIGDLNGDGRGELVAGADGVYSLSSTGELMWRYSTEGYVDHLALVSGRGGQAGRGLALTGYPDTSVSALDPEGGLAWRYELQASPTVAALEEIDSDGEQEVLVGSVDGTVCRLSLDGSLRWRSQVSGPVVDLVEADVNGDGVSEAVVGTGDYLSPGGVYVLDILTGAVLGFCEGRDVSARLDAGDVDGERGNEVVAASSRGQIFLLRWKGP